MVFSFKRDHFCFLSSVECENKKSNGEVKEGKDVDLTVTELERAKENPKVLDSSKSDNVAEKANANVIKSKDQKPKPEVNHLKNEKLPYPPTPPRDSPDQKMEVDAPDLPVDLSDSKVKSASLKSSDVEVAEENSTEDDELTKIKMVL